MIDTKIWQHGATSITVSVSRWKDDKVTPAMFVCRIEHEAHQPAAIVAERETPLAAERECVESFLEYFSNRKRPASGGTKALRQTAQENKPETKKAPKVKKPVVVKDDFDY